MKRTTAIAGLVLLLPVLLPAAQETGRRDPVTVDEKTETVIKGALRWLSSKQQPNGAWFVSSEERTHAVAMAGYTLMTYLSAGQLPGEGEFGKNVSAGVQFLLDATSPEGYMGRRDSGQYMYGHGIASIALAEVYGQTRSPALRPKLERVIKVIIAAQNREGGWRYRPVAHDADISVTVLQVTALRAAKNAGLDVPQRTIDQAIRYVKSCYQPSAGGFSYQPHGEAGFARTAAAIYSLQVCGQYDDELVKKGSEYLFKYGRKERTWFTYGNFYAAPAQYMIGGESWAKWYSLMKEILLDAVTVKGDQVYWEPAKLDPGRGVGPVYCTAVYTMILAMPYHYVPLYQR